MYASLTASYGWNINRVFESAKTITSFSGENNTVLNRETIFNLLKDVQQLTWGTEMCEL